VERNKALLEAEKQKKADELYEKEKQEMNPVIGTMFRTFNTSSNHDLSKLHEMRKSGTSMRFTPMA